MIKVPVVVIAKDIEFDAIKHARLVATDLRCEAQLSKDNGYGPEWFSEEFCNELFKAAEAMEKLDVATGKESKRFLDLGIEE